MLTADQPSGAIPTGGRTDGPSGDSEARLRAVCSGRSALLLEDDLPFANRMIDTLRSVGFKTLVHVERGENALAEAARTRFDVLILDRRNPGLEGLEVVRRLRAIPPAADNSVSSPVLIVTDMGDRDERIAALLSGARFDDYVPKQYVDWEELLARVAAQIERIGAAPGPVARYGAFEIDAERRELTFGGTVIPLSRREFDLMFVLVAHRGHPVTRKMLWDRCWTEWTFTPDDYVNIINTALRRLRRRLAQQLPIGLSETDSVIMNIWTQGLALRLIEISE